MENNNSIEEQNENLTKKKRWKFEWRNQDWVWLVLILVAIIYFISTFRLADNIQVVDLFSFISSSVSIALALVAIFYAWKQDSDNRRVNDNVSTILHNIVYEMGSVKNSVDKITSNDIDTIAQSTLEEEIIEVDRQPSYSADEVKKIVEEALNNFSQNVKTKVGKVDDNNNSLVSAIKNYINLKEMINEISNEKNGEFKSLKYVQKELLKRHGIELSPGQIVQIMTNKF